MIYFDLINDEIFSSCKRGVKLINVARGGIIDENSLVNAHNCGQCGGAALDVFQEEPPIDMKLTQHPLTICTHHLGASTLEAQKRVAIDLAQQIIDLKQGHSLIGVVNGSMEMIVNKKQEVNNVLIVRAARDNQIEELSGIVSDDHLWIIFVIIRHNLVLLLIIDIIIEADKLIREARHDFRLTMKFIDLCRFILCYYSTSRIILSIGSQCLVTRLAVLVIDDVC
ncbi:unnamed protein product [Rotaria socialis]|uniref:D-isomer specific 2-hydroxyacid dehydrogenase NAD-binding domain-containing protein n=2 Tax=Rotaria socialis TaxID=392032 RepID=A0A818LHU5_9BILA|nr:unnamed protein product [Rotaria socialis]CAF4812918.1 unnamed protein product [Rotaria socialis]